jgi:hypothetical protein
MIDMDMDLVLVYPSKPIPLPSLELAKGRNYYNYGELNI